MRQHGGDALESTEQAEGLHSLVYPNAAHELRDRVTKGLGHLAVEQRLVLALAYGAGRSLEEIARIMECDVSTVKARMFHAHAELRALRPVLAGHGSAHANAE